MSYSEIVAFIWGVADLIRDTFKRRKYQDVILPLLHRGCAPGKNRVKGPFGNDGDQGGVTWNIFEWEVTN